MKLATCQSARTLIGSTEGSSIHETNQLKTIHDKLQLIQNNKKLLAQKILEYESIIDMLPSEKSASKDQQSENVRLKQRSTDTRLS